MSSNHRTLSGRLTRCRVAAAIVFACIFPHTAFAAEPPNGIALEARLLTPISSYTARRNNRVTAVVATSICDGRDVVIPAGAELHGVVKRVHRVGIGLIHETAGLQLAFNELDYLDGRLYAVASRITGIDNARERVDGRGRIHGIRATATISNRVGERLAFAAMGHPVFLLPLFAAETGLLHFPDPEIEFKRGTVMQMSVEVPTVAPGAQPCPMPVQSSAEDAAGMQSLVDALPYWSVSKRQPQPMDLVNLLIVGSQDALERVFQAAGWIGSRENSMRAGVAAIRAIAEERSYSDAPMRTLLLDGRDADFRMQKSLDTFEKRDHLRIWRRDDELDGRPVWALAATRDLSTTFGLHPFGVTHRIEDDVDLERDKVVRDLYFTGCVDSVDYVQRPERLRENGRDYRKGISTDARVAVVALNACTQPRNDFESVVPMAQPGKAVRVIRRILLTARNHMIRDNLIYRSADAARLGYLAVRDLHWQAGQERRARALEAASH